MREAKFTFPTLGKPSVVQTRERTQELGKGQLPGHGCPFSEIRIPGSLLNSFFIQVPGLYNFGSFYVSLME